MPEGRASVDKIGLHHYLLKCVTSQGTMTGSAVGLGVACTVGLDTDQLALLHRGSQLYQTSTRRSPGCVASGELLVVSPPAAAFQVA